MQREMTSQFMETDTATVPLTAPARSKLGRVLMLTNALGWGGGAEEQVMLLSVGLRARGWTVKIVSLLPLYPLSPELQSSDISISSLHMKPGVPDPRAMIRLRRELRSFRPDIVHCHMPQANLLGRAVRPFCGFPVLISTLHNLTMERINGSSGRFLERAHGYTDRFSDVTTVICTPAVEHYVAQRAVPQSKITVLYNGVNTKNFQPDLAARMRVRRDLGVADKFVWLAIARFEKAKAYPNMIRAFQTVVANASKKPVILICGRGSLEAEIRSQVHSSGLDEYVKFIGVRQDVPDIMNGADAFVLSSYLEGLPMVLLQAASVGMPIVATNVGGNSEVVIDGLNGYTAPPEDDTALARAMTQVMQLSEAERAAMAERGRQLIRQTFDIERILDRWESIYEEKLRSKLTATSIEDKSDHKW